MGLEGRPDAPYLYCIVLFIDHARRHKNTHTKGNTTAEIQQKTAET